ncbi:hypothetical protein CC2G_005737 [Coprinopsis cinerea AmutBmut pab1-1]|nr:hypothetical protein CC2G_005737 [Coprinopsis cinerea AmutBmut pab1-1]
MKAKEQEKGAEREDNQGLKSPENQAKADKFDCINAEKKATQVMPGFIEEY